MFDSSLTFADMILRVSERYGVANQATTPGDVTTAPTDPAELDRIKRAINDAQDNFTRANPRWRALQPILSLTLDQAGTDSNNIDGDNGRLRLPSNWSIVPIGQWNWSDGMTGGRVQVRPIATLARMQAASQEVGSPQYVSIGPKAPEFTDGRGERRKELRVFPRPDQDYTLSGPARLWPERLVENDDRCPFGAEHDQTIILGAVFELLRNSTDPNQMQAAQAQYEQALATSKDIDGEETPRNTGRFGINVPGIYDDDSLGNVSLGINEYVGDNFAF